MSIVVDEKPFDEDTLDDNEELSNMEEYEGPSDEDKLEASITNADMPEKFKDKSAEEVAQAYQELEKQYGQKANEVGELRKLADDFLKRELDNTTKETVDDNPIELDDFLENPNDVVSKAIENSPKVKELENLLQQARIDEQRRSFESSHSDWQEVMSSPDFQEWITSNSILQQTFVEADRNYDYGKGSELLSMYKGIRGERTEEAKKKAATKRKKAMKASTTEKGSSGEAPKKVYLRTDLIRLKQTDPERYNAMGDEIRQAYAEKRVK